MGQVEGSSHAKNQPDSFSRFDRTPTFDRHMQTQGHSYSTRAVKMALVARFDFGPQSVCSLAISARGCFRGLGLV